MNLVQRFGAALTLGASLVWGSNVKASEKSPTLKEGFDSQDVAAEVNVLEERINASVTSGVQILGPNPNFEILVTGTNRADVISVQQQGTELKIFINGDAHLLDLGGTRIGKVTVDARNGNDRVDLTGLKSFGENFYTTTRLGNGNDTFIGSQYDDTVDGGSGKNVFVGNDGNDRFKGGSSTDSMTGGRGNDTYDSGTNGSKSRADKLFISLRDTNFQEASRFPDQLFPDPSDTPVVVVTPDPVDPPVVNPVNPTSININDTNANIAIYSTGNNVELRLDTQLSTDQSTIFGVFVNGVKVSDPLGFRPNGTASAPFGVINVVGANNLTVDSELRDRIYQAQVDFGGANFVTLNGQPTNLNLPVAAPPPAVLDALFTPRSARSRVQIPGLH